MEINTIIQGDCLDVLSSFSAASVDMVLTSPPYDNLREYKGYTFNFEGIAKELYRVVKDGGVVVWVVGEEGGGVGWEVGGVEEEVGGVGALTQCTQCVQLHYWLNEIMINFMLGLYRIVCQGFNGNAKKILLTNTFRTVNITDIYDGSA